MTQNRMIGEEIMVRILEYDDHYNVYHYDYLAMQVAEVCEEGEINDGWLALSEVEHGYRKLVNLEVVLKYEHDGVIYEVEEDDDGNYIPIEAYDPIGYIIH
jgi:anti-sigma regulatory factor (Ser/Thr protein kinase)